MNHGNNSKGHGESAVSSVTGDAVVVYTVFIRPDEHMVYGSENISKIIKRNPNEIAVLVKESGLIAWQDGPKGKWRALCADLLEFNRLEKERNSKPCQ